LSFASFSSRFEAISACWLNLELGPPVIMGGFPQFRVLGFGVIFRRSVIPPFRHSVIPSFRHSVIPPFHHSSF